MKRAKKLRGGDIVQLLGEPSLGMYVLAEDPSIDRPAPLHRKMGRGERKLCKVLVESIVWRQTVYLVPVDRSVKIKGDYDKVIMDDGGQPLVVRTLLAMLVPLSAVTQNAKRVGVISSDDLTMIRKRIHAPWFPLLDDLTPEGKPCRYGPVCLKTMRAAVRLEKRLAKEAEKRTR